MPRIDFVELDKPVDLETYRFTFGKYKGMGANHVLAFNAAYLVWCHHEVEMFKLSWRDLGKVRKRAYKQRAGMPPIVTSQAFEQHFDTFFEDEWTW